MTLLGETIATGADPVCRACRAPMKLGVYYSGAGHYVGTWCDGSASR